MPLVRGGVMTWNISISLIFKRFTVRPRFDTDVSRCDTCVRGNAPEIIWRGLCVLLGKTKPGQLHSWILLRRKHHHHHHISIIVIIIQERAAAELGNIEKKIFPSIDIPWDLNNLVTEKVWSCSEWSWGFPPWGSKVSLPCTFLNPCFWPLYDMTLAVDDTTSAQDL